MTITVVYSKNTDKYHYWYGPDAQASRDGTSGTQLRSNTRSYAFLGGLKSGSNFYNIPCFFQFDTTAIGDDIVSAVALGLAGYLDNSTIDAELEVRPIVWSGNLTTGFQTQADLAALPIVASFNTADYTTSYIPITSFPAFNTAIEGSGTTSIVVHYDGHATGVDPTGSEYIRVKTSEESGTTSDPKLTITHEAPPEPEITVIYADDTDKFIYTADSDLDAARSAIGARYVGQSSTDLYTLAGGRWSGTEYSFYQSQSRFDTSIIGTGTVSDVQLDIKGYTNFSIEDVVLEVRPFDWDGYGGVGSWQDAIELASLSVVATFDTFNYSSSDYMPFSSTDEFINSINGNGHTSLVIHHPGHVSGALPTENSYLRLKSGNYAGSTDDPKLTITHIPSLGPLVVPSAILL